MASGHDAGGKFAAGEHVVAYGDFTGNQVVADALVDAFVVPAENHDVFLEREFIRHPLVEGGGIGGGVDDFVVVTPGGKLVDAVEHGLYHHHQSRFPAEGIVVHFPEFVFRPVADVVDVDFHDAFVLSPLEDGVVQGACQQFRHNA